MNYSGNIDGATEVLPCEEVGACHRGQRFGQAANTAVPNRNPLVRQSSQDHEENDETFKGPSDGPLLTHSDSGHGDSLGLGESQDEANNTTKTVHRSVSHTGADINNYEMPGWYCAIQRSASQPATDKKVNEIPVRYNYSGSAQGQFLVLGENQYKTSHPVQRSASQPGPGTQSHEPQGKLSHSDSGQGRSLALGESQEEEVSGHIDIKSPSSTGVVSNGVSSRSLSDSTMSNLAPHCERMYSSHGTENIDSGIEKTPPISGTIFPFPPEKTTIVHSHENSTDANILDVKNDIGTRDQKKKELEGSVHFDAYHFLTNNSCNLSTVSSYDWLNTNCNDSSIPPPECSVMTSSYLNDISDSCHSMPSPPMVSKSSLDQLSRELSRTREKLFKATKDIETLQKSLSIQKKENDELNKKMLLMMNNEEEDKRNFGRQLSECREQFHREDEIKIQLKGKIEELNNLLKEKNEYIEQIERELHHDTEIRIQLNGKIEELNKYNEQIKKELHHEKEITIQLKKDYEQIKKKYNDIKTRNDSVEEKLEILWKKEEQCQEQNVRQDQVLNLSVRQNAFPEDDTIPKETFFNHKF